MGPPAPAAKARGGGKPKKPQDPNDPNFEKIHPRGRGGVWIKKGAGMTGEPEPQVKQLQNRLGSLGYHTQPDGRFGDATHAVLTQFQRDNGLQQSGELDDATVAALKAGGQGGPPGGAPPGAAASSGGYGDKYRGAAGADARAQQNFKLAGDANLTKGGTQNASGQDIDSKGQVIPAKGTKGSSGSGKSGSASRSSGMNASDPNSVRAYQQKNGLKVDGVVGPETQAALQRDRASKAKSGSGSRKRGANDGSVLHKGLGVGQRVGDKRVKELQTLLDGAGYNVGAIDGAFGPDTLKALKAFQRRMGLNPDGIFGPKSRRALNRRTKRLAANEKAKPGSSLEEAWSDEARRAAYLARIRNLRAGGMSTLLDHGVRVSKQHGGKIVVQSPHSYNEHQDTPENAVDAVFRHQRKATQRRPEAWRNLAASGDSETPTIQEGHQMTRLEERVEEAAAARALAAQVGDTAAFTNARAREVALRDQLAEATGKPWQKDKSKGEGMKRCPSCGWRNAKGTTKCKKCHADLAKAGDAKLSEADELALQEGLTELQEWFGDEYTLEELRHESLNVSPKKNWVERAGQLPAAIQHMANDIHKERGLPLAQAIPIAISQAKKLAAKGNAKYVAAVAEWEALKAKNAAKKAA